MMKSRLLGTICACITVFSTDAIAIEKYWICGDGFWDDASCWNPYGQPLGATGYFNGDNVFLTQADNVDRLVTYANTYNPSDPLQSLTIDSTGSGTMTLSVSQDSLEVRSIKIGVDGVGVFNQGGGTVEITPYGGISLGSHPTGIGTYNLSNGFVSAEIVEVGYNNNIYDDFYPNAGTGTFNMTGGSAYMYYLRLGRGDFNLSNGSLDVAEVIIYSNSVFNQAGGDATFFGGSGQAIGGTYNLTGGNLGTSPLIYGNGVINNTGGNHTAYGLLLLHNISYNLSGTGSLTTGSGQYSDEIVGLNSGAYFNQSNGTNSTTILSLGGSSNPNYSYQSDGNGNGTYSLSGGSLSANNEVIGSDGIGTFNQTGGVNTVSDTMILAETSGSSGTYNLSGGRLEATNIVVNNGGEFNFAGGTLLVDNFTGNLNNDGGTLEPGNSLGITNIFGDYTQSIFGIYTAEIAGLVQGSEYDLVSVTGTATLSGILDVNLLNTSLFTPGLGDTFDILLADTILGEFDIELLATLDGDLDWDVSYILDPFNTDIVRLSVVQAVPAPAALYLFGSGLLGLIWVARKKAA